MSLRHRLLSALIITAILSIFTIAHATTIRHAYNHSRWRWTIELEGIKHTVSPGQTLTIMYENRHGHMVVTNQEKPSRCVYHYRKNGCTGHDCDMYISHLRSNTGAIALNSPADGDIIFTDEGGDNGWCFW